MKAHGTQKLQVARVDRGLDQHDVGNLGVEQRFAGAKNPTQSLIGIQSLRLVASELFRQGEPRRVNVCHGDRFPAPVLVDQIDCAPIGHLGDGKLGNVA
jgi:hypothetical protein